MSAAWRLGSIFREVREARAESLRDAARPAGVSHVYLAAVERGDRLPAAAWALRYAAAQGLDRHVVRAAWQADAADLALAEWLEAEREVPR